MTNHKPGELAFLSGMLPYLEVEVAKMRDATIARALGQLRAQTLTPEAALFLWMEINAVDGLLKRMETRVKLPK